MDIQSVNRTEKSLRVVPRTMLCTSVMEQRTVDVLVYSIYMYVYNYNYNDAHTSTTIREEEEEKEEKMIMDMEEDMAIKERVVSSPTGMTRMR
jgi:hypothetical protein